MVESEVKDDFMLKNEVLPSKNVIFVYKGYWSKGGDLYDTRELTELIDSSFET